MDFYICRYLYFLLFCYAISPDMGAEGYKSRPSPRNVVQDVPMPTITKGDIETAFANAKKRVQAKIIQERKLFKEGRIVNRKVKSAESAFYNIKATPAINRQLADRQALFDEASDYLIKKYKLNSRQVTYGLPQLPLDSPNAVLARKTCTSGDIIQCDKKTPYRTIDGVCNNFANPRWGSALSCFDRLLPSVYDGESGFRMSENGGPLPEPRTLSLSIHSNVDSPATGVNHLYMYFGQLISHDISLTSISTTVNNELIECCPVKTDNHPQCAPIIIARNDSFYSEFDVTCLNFVRSQICPYCTLGTRNQMNQITAFIDASFVYDSQQNLTDSLRTCDGTGMLRVQRTQVGDLLPQNDDPANDQCSIPSQNQICFTAGDPRVNQHPTLASLHTLFVREHNRIAAGLKGLNPSWNEERLFQETRKIVGAEMQMITYNEYLPVTLGRERMSFYRLWLSNESTSYDSTLNPTLYTEFSTAALRVGHTFINSGVGEFSSKQKFTGLLLRNDFFQPFAILENEIDLTLKISTISKAQNFDRYMVPDVTNFLHRVKGSDTGLDLAAYNIQRGRDHGLAGYTAYVRFCSQGEVQIRSFEDLVCYQLMTPETVIILRRNYRNVNDIDLWTGCISEIPQDGAVIGPTAICIRGLQFNRLKFGDRFYFEHGGQPGSFTPLQLRALKKVTFSRIICDNTGVTEMPRNAMHYESSSNPLMSCQQLPSMDLSAWQE